MTERAIESRKEKLEQEKTNSKDWYTTRERQTMAGEKREREIRAEEN